MSLFRKPSTKKIGLKVLVFGERGSGKSIFGLSFPKSYALDSEAGLALYENHPVFGRNLMQIANTQDFTELSEAIDEIGDLVEDDPNALSTLIIDSETNFYNNLTDSALTVEERKARQKGRDVMDSAVSMRGWGRVKAVASRLSALKIDLSAKGVNIVSVSQMDDVKEKQGENFVKVGVKPVMQKGSEYHYDLVLELFTEIDAKGDAVYKARTLKDRTGVTSVGQITENPSYEIWKEYAEGRKDGELLNSNLAKDADKSLKELENQDAEDEMSDSDKLKALMEKSEDHKAKAVELIKASKIKNPLAPTAGEIKKLRVIVEELEKIGA